MSEDLTGRSIASYRLTSKLGEGGMGEVYRATDAKLGREVAVKVLPARWAADPEALARFEREAKAVAALSHPNILTIFDFGRDGEVVFAAMELLEGETLGERLAGGPLPVRKALEIAAEVAEGLAAAHERGVVHRDLKPANIFMVRDGRAKILDFGLARLVAAADSQSQLVAAPTRGPGTEVGTVLGTVGYMAPEQVRGLAADHRADVFALGVVVYEMLTGQRAFTGDSAAETMTAILREEPGEIERIGARFSPAVGRLVQRCLEKRPEDRFQSARDLAADLRWLAAGGSSAALGAAVGPAAGGSVRRRLGAVALLVLGAGVGALGSLVAARRGAPATEIPRLSFRQLTKMPGGEGMPAMAPDGESFVFVKRDGQDLDLFVQRVDGARTVSLTADCAADDFDPAFSRDGRWLAYRSECDGGGVFVIGATGEARRRVADFGYAPAWSPDGRELAVVTERLDRPTSRNSTSQLWAVRVDTGERRRVTLHDAMGPTWSPDGRRIAFWGLDGESFQRDLWSVAADGSQMAAESASRMLDDPAIDWAPVYSGDGRFLYFASTRGGTFNLWRLPLDLASGAAAGAPQPVTAPSSSAGPFSLSADGRRLAFVDRNVDSEIVRARFDPSRRALVSPAEPFFGGSFELREHKLSSDGQWILFTNEDPPQHLHLVRFDGTGYRQLTTDGDRNRQGEWSPNGDWIVFQTTGGDSTLAVIRPDGGGRAPLGAWHGLSTPRWSPDGNSIASFDSSRGGMLIDVRAGFAAAQRIDLPPVEEGVLFWPGAWSPDGLHLAGRATRQGRPTAVVIRSMRTGAYRSLPRSGGALEGLSMVFLDPRLVVSIDSLTMWLNDLEGGAPRQLYAAAPGRTIGGVSTDRAARWLTWIERGDESDIWLMSIEEPGGRPQG